MTTDFKASQVQTSKVIVTGSFAGGSANQLLVYSIDADSPGTPNQGVIDTAAFSTSGIGSDVFLFVSGSTSTKDVEGSQGVSVIGGDLHVSGNLTVNGTYPAGGGGGVAQWEDGSNRLATTSSVALAGALGTGYYANNVGSDVFFFVSGATENNSGYKAVFGGTTFVSGNLQVPFQTKIESRNLAGNGYLGIARYVNGGGTNILLVGDSDGNNNGVAIKGEGVGSGQLAGVLALITGSNAGFFSGSYQFPQGISGSLTRLTDGSPYLIPGSGIQTSTGSNGAVTISTTGGGGFSLNAPMSSSMSAPVSLGNIYQDVGAFYVPTTTTPTTIQAFVTSDAGLNTVVRITDSAGNTMFPGGDSTMYDGSNQTGFRTISASTIPTFSSGWYRVQIKNFGGNGYIATILGLVIS